jgi:GNAT superfamily N-acetyltransferase
MGPVNLDDYKDICRDKITPGYIREQLEAVAKGECEMWSVSGGGGNQLRAFIIYKRPSHQTEPFDEPFAMLHVELLCVSASVDGQGFGTRLLQKVQKELLTWAGPDVPARLRLAPITSAMLFYSKLGFRYHPTSKEQLYSQDLRIAPVGSRDFAEPDINGLPLAQQYIVAESWEEYITLKQQAVKAHFRKKKLPDGSRVWQLTWRTKALYFYNNDPGPKWGNPTALNRLQKPRNKVEYRGSLSRTMERVHNVVGPDANLMIRAVWLPKPQPPLDTPSKLMRWHWMMERGFTVVG